MSGWVVSSELQDNVPNPNDGHTTIYYTLSSETPTGEIQIMDICGKLIEVTPVSSENNSIEYNCSNCSNGIYFYSIVTGNTKIGTKKMVIEK